MAEAKYLEELQGVDELLEEVEGEIEVLLSRQAELQAKKEKLLRLVQQEQRAPQADWKHGSFSWDSAVQEKLHKVFGIPGFTFFGVETITIDLLQCAYFNRVVTVSCSRNITRRRT